MLFFRCVALFIALCTLFIAPGADSQTTQPTCKTQSLDASEQKRIKDQLAQNDFKLTALKDRLQKGTTILDKWKQFSSEARIFADQVGEYIQRCRDVDKSWEDAKAKGHERFRVPHLRDEREKCRNDERQLTNKLLWYQKEMQLIGSQIGEIEDLLGDLNRTADNIVKEKRLLELQTSVDRLVNELGQSIENFESKQATCTMATQ